MRKLLLIVLLISFGCKKSAKQEKVTTENNYTFDYISQISSQMGNSLTDSPNKVVIRIWMISGLIQPDFLYTFYQDGSNYNAQLCTFYQDSISYTVTQINDTLEDKKPHYLLDSLTCFRIKTHLPVKDIIDTTFSLGIDKLKSQPHEAKARTSDGETYVVEINKGKDYHIIEYSNPEYFQDPDHKKFTQYLNTVFNWKL